MATTVRFPTLFDPPARTGRNPYHPPDHGPHGEAEYDSDARRWTLRLKDSGHAVITSFLERYPRPWVLLWKVAPRIASIYLRGHPDEADLEAACLVGVCRAATKFDPARGHQFVTLATWCMRSDAHHFHRRQLRRPAAYQLAERYDAAFREPEEADDGTEPPLPFADAVLADCTPAQRRVLTLRFADGLTVRQAAREMALSVDRVKARTNRAKAKIRERWAGTVE